MRPSLQRRMLNSVVIGMAFILTVFGVVMYSTLQNNLLRQIRTNLLSAAQMVAASVEVDEQTIELEIAVDQLADFNNPQTSMSYQIWDLKGRTVAKSPLLDPYDLPLPSIAEDQGTVFDRCRIGDTGSAFYLGIQFVPRQENTEGEPVTATTPIEPLMIAVSRDTTDYQQQCQALGSMILSTSLSALLLAVLVAWAVVWRGLRPIHIMAEQIASISAADLCARIQVQNTPRELAPVTLRLNELLDRLQTSFARERQFTADVAHELRTPLTGLRSILEVSMTRPRENQEYLTSLEACSEITHSMQRMMENLLTLARLDAQRIEFQSKVINLANLVDACWQGCRDQAAARSVTFQNHIQKTREIQSDPDYLAMVLTNLFNNAVEYTNIGGSVTVECKQDLQQVHITVSNTGCTLTTDQIDHIFDCFWRADTSRSDIDLHSGLGLALIHRIVAALGGRARADINEGEFRVHIDGLQGAVDKQ